MVKTLVILQESAKQKHWYIMYLIKKVAMFQFECSLPMQRGALALLVVSSLQVLIVRTVLVHYCCYCSSQICYCLPNF